MKNKKGNFNKFNCLTKKKKIKKVDFNLFKNLINN